MYGMGGRNVAGRALSGLLLVRVRGEPGGVTENCRIDLFGHAVTVASLIACTAPQSVLQASNRRALAAS